jgi:hypothetical protein
MLKSNLIRIIVALLLVYLCYRILHYWFWVGMSNINNIYVCTFNELPLL